MYTYIYIYTHTHTHTHMFQGQRVKTASAIQLLPDRDRVFEDMVANTPFRCRAVVAEALVVGGRTVSRLQADHLNRGQDQTHPEKPTRRPPPRRIQPCSMINSVLQRFIRSVLAE